MAKLIPFSGTVAQLYNSYGQACFVGYLSGVGQAGHANKVSGTIYFYAMDGTHSQYATLNGFVIV